MSPETSKALSSIPGTSILLLFPVKLVMVYTNPEKKPIHPALPFVVSNNDKLPSHMMLINVPIQKHIPGCHEHTAYITRGRKNNNCEASKIENILMFGL